MDVHEAERAQGDLQPNLTAGTRQTSARATMLALALGSALLAAQGAVENITVYRITPQNYTGVTNMGELLSCLPTAVPAWRLAC